MDDKAAVAVALNKRDARNPSRPQYDEVILVMTGAADRDNIAEGMRQYLQRAERHQPALSSDWKNRVSWFQTRGNVMGKVVAHERWYKDLRPSQHLPVATGQSLAAAVARVHRSASVDMFQLAPCEDRDVYDFINAVPNINIYHLFFGYNSRQGSASSGMSSSASRALAQRQSQFHATLQQRLQARHGADARVIFTQNVPTFNDPRAGSQELGWCQRYFPEQDTTMSLSDPFWTSLIREANPYADRSVRLTSIPDNEDTFLQQVVGARMHQNSLRGKIYAMLYSAAQSSQFASNNPRSQHRVSKILVPEFQGSPDPTLELGDANHITAVLGYLDQEQYGGSGAGRLVPAACDTSGTDPSQPPAVTTTSRSRGEGWVLTNCDIRQIRNKIENILRRSA
ncbi:hypothetical protein MCOR07_004352 [Pyricularia oryzae]|nr:hypothetical protein MCOR29_004175 [Pyricularia oryzae]KAI6427506.1 hypothetical protein MCOR21_006053 [Pyricularia oryzae]KAI6561370.1 hypothetical protein MCOR09_008141 [Pyricularia oryzae]KAI6589930.1 hypothetical protein MCOR06_005272 [Pyricularia oryzae]KAI6622518.1 hypothetical protein MCOR07_004352 [Pyricularia oryzae]